MQKNSKTFKERVLAVDDERSIDNGIIINLNKGWKFPYDSFYACHTWGVDTHAEVLKAVADAVPCDCSECNIK